MIIAGGMGTRAIVSSPFKASRATLALNDGLCFLRFCFMFSSYSIFIIGAEPALSYLSKFRGPPHYERVKTFLREYKPQGKIVSRLQFQHIRALVKSIWFLGIREKGRRYYWKLFLSTLLKQPRKFPLSISLAVYGYHFRKVAEKYISLTVEGPGSSVGHGIRVDRIAD